MKIFQVSLLIGISTMMVACPDVHPVQHLKWDDSRILRGTYTGDYERITDSGFEKVGTLKFQFTPHYVNESKYDFEPVQPCALQGFVFLGGCQDGQACVPSAVSMAPGNFRQESDGILQACPVP
ncbi:hypothetical protein [Deinococcus roseus]|uniref:hypothetical protein n=1 Tax=Deinococcus roseus TaxID=392414 RepID=UPI00166A42C0|nr:hypothetical protein [Deinococcus roseus]